MTYIQRHNRNFMGEGRNTFVIIVIVIAVFIGIHFIFPNFFPTIIGSVSRPIWRIEYGLSLGLLSEKDNLILENQELKRQISEADLKLAYVNSLESEIKSLKMIAGRSTASTTDMILAAVIMRPPATGYDEMIVDIGEGSGISTSSLVYGVGNVILGKIVNVGHSTSKVRLFSSPDEKHQVLIGDSRIVSTAIGRGGGQYTTDLPRDIEIKVGDQVVLPSISTTHFGIVTKVLSDPAQPYSTVLFSTPINIYNLDWVYIETNIKR